ncbi:alpha/beta hydrolase [Streptomyces chartreusis]|uniref:alpha/beta hydrolase n=1 Tax=Streptomyces chartreusis TaxID=1969 RepID=UPI0036CB76C1
MTTTSSPTETPTGPPPPFDPELDAVLEPIREHFATPLTAELISVVRQGGLTPPPTRDDIRNAGYKTEEQRVPGPLGAPDISLLICRRLDAPASTGALYYIHGGGMIMGDNRGGLLEILELAGRFQLAVVSVEYRLAPEHPYPAPVEDCYAGFVWTAEHAAEIGIDPDRIVVVGSSAGGGLGAGTALLTRDRGGPAPLGQLLIGPMLDDRNDTYSARQMAGVDVWNRTSNQVGWTALLGDACGGPDVSPYAAPARATDLTGLSPTFLDVGSAETFRDETVALATRIWQAGGQAELHVWPGAYHGFDHIAPHAAVSQDAREARARWLRRLLGD